MKGHQNKVHANKRFECETCCDSFKQMGSFLKHVAAKHEKTKYEKCNICERTFSYIHELEEHEKSHI